MKFSHIFSVVISCIACASMHAQQKSDTLYVSDMFTTHIIHNTDLIYADLSNSHVVAAKILDQSKNMIAMKARMPFDKPLSVSALESNGIMHTYIVLYQANPQTLVYDVRNTEIRLESDKQEGKGAPKSPGMYRKWDAPLIQDVVGARQNLWHISSRQYDIEVSCTNILSYSDVTYMVFNLKNSSGVSYDCPDATFVIESKKKTRKSVVYDKNIFPKSRYGTLSCAPGESTEIGYSMEKLSLAKDQVLRVYFYEQGGQRELVLTVSAKDINRAKSHVKK